MDERTVNRPRALSAADQKRRLLIDSRRSLRSRMPLVTAFAAHFGAQLHVLDVVPPVTEATVVDALDAKRPLTTGACLEEIKTLFARHPGVKAHAEIGCRGNELGRLLDRCDVDVLFVGHEQAERGVVRPRFARDLDRLPCPVVCLADAYSSFTGWSFERVAMEQYALRHEELAPAGYDFSAERSRHDGAEDPATVAVLRSSRGPR